jgi:mRNA interferase RelE/StbE
MEIEFLSKFSEDIDSISQKNIKKKLIKTIELCESAKILSDIPQIKKLAGHKNAYRIRIGTFRIGIFLEGNRIQFARILDRKDIYKVFP